jgi:hypothetical protein
LFITAFLTRTPGSVAEKAVPIFLAEDWNTNRPKASTTKELMNPGVVEVQE